ncbi:hypothetical protein [Cylindrospermum stagnale]|nr:hypothetical protein [Cylindrospermum stagnale]
MSNATIHVFDSQRMPYLILQDDGSLLVLHGVNPPDSEVDYYGIEIPITRSVEPGEVVSYQVKLTPLYLVDHYERHRTPTDLHGVVVVHCLLGWGETPILVSERQKKSVNFLLNWQHLVNADPIQVNLPNLRCLSCSVTQERRWCVCCRLDGKKVQLVGIYRKRLVYKKKPRPFDQTAPVFTGHIFIEVEGSPQVYNPYQPPDARSMVRLGLEPRPSAEIERFVDQKVTVEGKLLICVSSLAPPPEVAQVAQTSSIARV